MTRGGRSRAIAGNTDQTPQPWRNPAPRWQRLARMVSATALAVVFVSLSSAARDPNEAPAVGPAAATDVTEPRATDAPFDPAGVRFEAVDVTIDAGDVPLAAYQFELTAAAGEFTIVGVEGGAHPAFARPPYYDPAALAQDRIILAAFSTSENLPVGRTRVATVHVMVAGDAPPEYDVGLTVAAGADGAQTPAEINVRPVAVE